MSFQCLATTLALKPMPLCPSKRLLILAVSYYADDHTLEVGEFHQTLADFCCMSKDTAKRHISKLVDWGYLSPPDFRQPEGGGLYRNYYRLRFIHYKNIRVSAV